MFSDTNVKAILAMILMTCLALASHKLGLMNISLSILDDENPTFVTHMLEGGVLEGELNQSNQQIESSCKKVDSNTFSMCGISIGLNPQMAENTEFNIQSGIDLSIYDNVELEIEYQSPNNESRLRFSLRNYNTEYSQPKDFVSLKFNSVIFDPKLEQTTVTVPFDSFRVEDWWIKEKNISFENAQFDIDNVVFIEIMPDDMSQEGVYSFVVKQVLFHGELIDELGLFQIILICWLVFIIILVSRQTKKLKHISNTDALTQLLNRRGITAWAERNGASFANRRKGYLFYFDIDGFKKVNDTHGHSIGDELLCELGKIVTAILLENDPKESNFAFARLAGDEFVILFNRLEKEQAERIADNIVNSLSAPIQINNRLIRVGLSMGLASFEPLIDTFEETLSQADSAMYCAKQDGKNRYRLFDEHVRDVIYRRKQIAENIRVASENGQFSMAYMPIFRSSDLYIHKVEVLLRCHSAALEGIGPDEFIPIAEEFGVIQNIDLLVIETTFRHMYRHQKVFNKSDLVVCINISAKELNNVKFASALKGLIKDYRINPQNVQLEITETSLVEIDEQSITILNEIRETGISLALDDFGTGYTAFSQIIKYPIDCLKIDKSFIDDLHSENEVKKTLVKSILAIAKSYKLQTVAEGIEKDEQFKLLKEMGCDSIQGYLLSKPISWEHFKTLLQDQDGQGNVIKIAN
ncbi:putative bifunctional diguanylate cyclase/phosphodiesterase [Brumicola blandensis]|uniref:EAL domain-containing protein n=1 Tax=Brumicola blandensis TaxID=3075611 RepID=A0AAW8R021_9ALTE|nr:EAL domain-containing protein [Alteromonas sp. W409]MDT0581558.1 EAL domain-containing protein [Alteromonas sp. W409]